MRRAAVQVMVLSVLSKLLGFVREIVLSYVFGASAITDAYLISQTVPRIIFALVGASIATGFVPMYSRVRSERDRQTADAFTNNLLNALLCLALVTVASVLVFARPLVRLFASGFQGPTMELAIKFTRITAFGTFFTGSMSIFASYLRLHGNFIVPALVGLPMNFVIIGSIFVSSKTSVYALAIGSVLATISELLICIPFLRRVDYVFKPVLDLSDEHLRAMVFIAVPVIVGISVTEINVLVDRTLASRIAVGGISALNYARRLNDSIQTIFVTSLTTVFYPLISKMAAEGNMGKLKITLAEALSLVNLLVVPATVGTMVFPREIVSLLFARGAFSQEAAAMTSDALFFYSIGMTAVALRNVLARGFYALQDTRTPMVNSAIAAAVNVVLNIIFARYLGIGGLALATSISGILSVLLMFVSLRRRIGPFGMKQVIVSLIKISASSIIMGLAARASFRFLQAYLTDRSALIPAVIVGVLTYAFLVFILRVPEIERTIGIIKVRANRSGTREYSDLKRPL